MLTASYICQAKTKVIFLKAIGDANYVLQTRGYEYVHCLDVFDIFIKEVRENKDDRDHVLYGCKLSTKYIQANNHLSTDHQFSMGVYKIQSNIEAQYQLVKNEPVCAF